MQVIKPDRLRWAYDASDTPIATLDPGETVEVVTEDCFSGLLRDPAGFTDPNREWLRAHLDGLTGPIEVRGAKPGDVLAVRLDEVTIATPGTVVYSHCADPAPFQWWGEEFASEGLPTDAGSIRFPHGLAAPVRPVVGCIGVAPADGAPASTAQGRWGGNMDCPLITGGTTVLLPVEADGALLYLGDCKAAMGAGEIGQPPEAGAVLRLTVQVLVDPAGTSMLGPRIEGRGYRGSIVSHEDVAEAARLAYRDLLDTAERDTGLPRHVLSAYLASTADVGICQVSNARPTAHCVIPSQLWPVPRHS